MKLNQLLTELNAHHQDLLSFIENSNEDFLNAKENPIKWSRAEETGHLIKSLQQSNIGLSLPKFFLKYKFGLNNRKERTFDEVVEKYKNKLAENPLPNNPFVLKQKVYIVKENLLQDYTKEQLKFSKLVSKFTEDELSKYLIPHPLLGRMTIREFVYFTIFHTKHHLTNITKNV